MILLWDGLQCIIDIIIDTVKDTKPAQSNTRTTALPYKIVAIGNQNCCTQSSYLVRDVRCKALCECGPLLP